ncbi:cysteine hydrolase [candidate division FCPU426 bacterium]|nr:cysteine hydrolase [candidate division FCPU426 bacterium]
MRMKKIFLLVAGAMVVIFMGLFGVLYQFAAATKGTPIPAYQTDKAALLVIDIQKDLTEKDGKHPLNLAQTDAMIPVVNSLIKIAEENDWLVIYITHEYRKNSILRLVTRDILLEGMPGANMDPRILTVSQNHFVKHRMDAFTNSDFDAFLRKNEVNQLVLTGMAAEACVDRTCQGAINREYGVKIVRNAVAGESDESREVKIRDYEKYGAKIVYAEELLHTQ